MIHNKNFKAWVEDNRFNIIYHCENLTLDIAEEALKARLTLSNNQTFPMLSDIRNIKRVGSDARKFLANKENNELLSAGAILVNNQFQKIAGNLFLLTNNLPVPGKLFTDESQALSWLDHFKIDNSGSII